MRATLAGDVPKELAEAYQRADEQVLSTIRAPIAAKYAGIIESLYTAADQPAHPARAASPAAP